MSQNNAPQVYAVHAHQKQQNAQDCDQLYYADGSLQAAFILLDMAEDYGVLREEHGYRTEDDLDRLREIDVGSCLLRLLCSREWYVSGTESTDEPDEDGTVGFRLVRPCAPQVAQREVVLIRRVYSP